MKPKNIVITGANSGIGYQTAKTLYEQGHNIIFGARNTAKNQQAITEITKKAGGSIAAFPLDLSQRKSIEQFAKNVKSKFTVIDILVNNAGLMMDPPKKTSELGFEMTLTINHFGPFYLTYLLWENIVKSPEARVINVSSDLSYRAPNNYLQDLQCNNKSYSDLQQYNISKLYNVLFTQGLNNLITKHSYKNIKTASLHPGIVSTNFGGDSCMIKFFRCICCCIVKDSNEGARTSLYLCNAPFAQVRSGQYYDDSARWKEMDRRGRNQEDVGKLWAISEKAYGITFQ